MSIYQKKLHCGEVIQYGKRESDCINIIWEGSVVVCENTEFKEPFLVYKFGATLNIYQIMMDEKLPFDYRGQGTCRS